MANSCKKVVFINTVILFILFNISLLTSRSNLRFGRDHSGMQKHYRFEVMYDYNKKYRLHHGPAPTGSSAWMVSDVIEATRGTIQTIVYTPDGKNIIVGDDDGLVTKIDLATKRKIWKVKPYHGETNMYVRIRHLTVSPNGRYVALGCRFQYVGEPKWLKILDAYTGRTIRTIKMRTFNRNCWFRGKPTFICTVNLKFSKNNRFLYSLFVNEKTGNFGGCAVVKERYLMKINLSNGRIVWRYNVPVPAVSGPGIDTIPAYNCALPSPRFDVSYLGNYLAVGGCNGNLMILNKHTGRELFRVPSVWLIMKKFDLYGGIQVAHLQFSNKRRDILYLSSGHAAAAYLHTRVNLTKRKYTPLSVTSDYTPIIMSSPNESYLACGGRALFIWNMKTGKAIKYVNFRPGPGVKHTFKPKVNPVYQEFAVVERDRGIGHVLLVHRKKRKQFYASAGTWKATGVYVNYKTAFYLQGRGNVQLGYKSSEGLRDPEKLFATPIWQTPFRTTYYVLEGGQLYIRPNSSGTFYIYGGLTQNRNYLPRWGQRLPSVPEPTYRSEPRETRQRENRQDNTGLVTDDKD